MARDPLPFDARLWRVHHPDGSVTVQVLGAGALRLWGPDPSAVTEALQLALSDRIERSHPRLLEPFFRAPTGDVVIVDVPRAIHAVGCADDEDVDDPRRHLPATVSVVVTDRGEWCELWIPRVDARHFVAARTDPVIAARELVTDLIARWSPQQRTSLLSFGTEALSSMTIEAAPAPLGSFSGPDAPRDMLPEPIPEEPSRQVLPDGTTPPPTPTLDKVALALHELAAQGHLPRAHRRGALTDRLLQMVAAGAGPIVLVGPRGVGKSAVLDEIACRIAARDAPTALRGRPVVFADAGRLIAGEGSFGGWQQQLLGVIQEAASAEVVWVLGELLPLLDAGKHSLSEQNVAQMLKPALGAGGLRVVGECHDAAWAELQLRNPGFARVFTPVRVEEPDADDTMAILEAVAGGLAKNATMGPDALRAVLDLSRRYGARTSLVGASVQLLRRLVDAAAADAAPRDPAQPRSRPPSIDRHDVVGFVCEETGLPPFLVRDDVTLDRDAVAADFAARILGQDSAVQQMADLVTRIKAGVSDDRRPLGAFLFIGPTGVGKTEMVKALAALLYGREDRIVRFDMSEYAGADCIDRLLGTDPSRGLVGQVAQAPFSVVLLDEVEKAHPAVFDLLLQILGEARLSDRSGRLADFRNSIVLMTSNLGVDTFRTPSGFSTDGPRALREHLVAEVHRFFRPELVGRLDEIVAFEPLGHQPVARITDRELAKVARREGLRGRQISLVLGPEVPQWLAERGVDLRYGARPLKRTIERRLVVPIAKALSRRKRAPRAVQVTARKRSLQVRPHESMSETAALDSALLPALEACATLRWRLAQWAEVPTMRRARQEVALVDRLSNTKVFWRDKAAARTRLGTTEHPRRLVEAHQELLDRVEALEDLLIEAWSGMVPPLGDDARTELLDEVQAAETGLDSLQWTIAGSRAGAPSRVTLWVTASKDSAHTLRTMEPLIWAYLRIAMDAGWTVRPQPIDRSAKAPEEPLTDYGRLTSTIRGWPSQCRGVRLHVVGDTAAAMLAPERGIHQLSLASGALSPVAVSFRPSLARGRPSPLQDASDEPQRIVDVARSRIRDLQLKHQRGLGKLPEVMRSMMRDRMLRRFFSTSIAGRMA